MMRCIFAICLMIAVALAPATSRAAEDTDKKILGLSNTAFAVGVATVITGARIAFVVLAGNTVFGRSLGTGRLIPYLGHAVAEGIIEGVRAGAGTWAMSAPTSEPGERQPPR